MYIPTFYAIEDPAESLAIARDHGFGALVVDGDGSHVPFVVDEREDGHARLRFHLARGNGLIASIADGARMLMIVSGPHSYISPDWYVSDDQVPTWNYVAVHLRGQGRILDADELRTQVDDLSAANEARLAPKRPWTSAKMTPRRLEGMLRAIVGVEMVVDTIEGARKLGQNKTEADRAGVVDALRARGSTDERAVAELMEGTLEPAI